MGDPNDTLSLPRSSRRPLPKSRGEIGRMLVDRHARYLIEWSVEWGHRDRGVEGLIAQIFDCGCSPSVERREDFERENPYYTKNLDLPKGRRGYLPVLVHIDEYIFAYDLAVPPGLEVPDSRAVLAPPSAARLAQMERWLDSGEVGLVSPLVRRSLSRGMGSMYVLASAPFPSTFRLELIGYDPDLPLLHAARFPSSREKIRFFLEPEGSEGWSLIWVAPERLGLSEIEVDQGLCPDGCAQLLEFIRR